MRFRSITVTMIVLALATLGLPVAQAAAPSNDDFANATVVAALPFTDTVDTTEATTASNDPSCSGNGESVWYSLTPAVDGWIQVDTFGSDYDTVLGIYTGSAGALTEIACNDQAAGTDQSRVRINAVSGTTYHVMAATWEGTSGGGTLVLNAAVSSPPFSLDDVTINPLGRVRPKTGDAVISGSITCSNGPGFVELDVFVSQRIGRALVEGDGFDFFECSGTQSWSIEVAPFNGLFVAGRAHAYADAFGPENEFFSTDAGVRLQGH
jgi:hypothetical protein